ncbi:MAG: hypothetical protein KDD10_11680 [Phaeodactylibacter sp.]|nr:hypothetical protein [Phaeodactylibacter sp.]MCB9295103.1 hypothetical protein [Lewinellaceae bacterium]
MKYYLLLFSLALLFGAAKCGNQNDYQLGQLFRLQLGESARCHCPGPTIQFTAIKEDSRCPEFTNCIWEGQAVIQFSLEKGERQYVDLTLRAGHPELASKKVGDYIYRLEKVSPYPQAGKAHQPEEYVVEMVVEGI